MKSDNGRPARAAGANDVGRESPPSGRRRTFRLGWIRGTLFLGVVVALIVSIAILTLPLTSQPIVYTVPPKVPPLLPELVEIKGGCFAMGQTESEKLALLEAAGDEIYHKYFSDEQPFHTCVGDFSLARTEVTVGEFRRFVMATGYVTEGEREEGCYHWDIVWHTDVNQSWASTGFEQRDSHPVVCVSWHDAMQYVSWLSTVTGKSYRLPTDAEWEYAVRAGTTTPRYWANTVSHRDTEICDYENVADVNHPDESLYACDDGFAYTSAVGTYVANPWGIHDALGNVSEWTCSEFNVVTDERATHCAEFPAEGERVIRGGSWDDVPRFSRAADRNHKPIYYNFDFVGFRVAKDLS